MIHGVVSGLIAVIETFASVKIFVQFVDITCGAEARPRRTCKYQLGQDSRTEDLLNAIVTHACRALGEDVIRILFLHRSPEGC